MAFLIGGANSSAADAAYDIDNSVRFDGAAANGFARFGNNSRDGKTFTISFWIKRTELGAVQQLVNSKVEDSGANSFLTTINSTDQLAVSGTFTSAENQTNFLITNNLLRDVSAWYHIVFRSDTTQSGETDRFKFYINGTEASYATDNRANISQDDTWSLFYNTSSYPYAISNDERDNVYGDYYMAEHHYCDGVSNAASAFGETDEDSGIWKPKKYTGSHGTYGHFLEFKNSGAGSGTTAIGGHNYTTGSSSTIGADTSGNDNHFHVQGYAVTDQCTDSPTNNFCTINSIFADSGNNTVAADYSEGNTKMLTTNDGWKFGRGTFLLTSGKWYAEVKATETGTGQGGNFGIVPSQGGVHLGYTDDNDVFEGIRIILGGSDTELQKVDTGTGSAVQTFASGNTAILAIDLDNNKLWVGVNGTWWNDNNASATLDASNEDITLPTVTAGWVFGIGAYRDGSNNLIWEYNWGNPPNAISSGNADANGYGNFEYAVPSGFYALCTKNLAEYG